MSKTPKNKKYLELQGVRIYHNKKDNSIQLISTDPDLTGKPFHITLNHGTETEKSIRELLIEKEIITTEQSDPQLSIPEQVYNPYLQGISGTPTSDPLVQKLRDKTEQTRENRKSPGQIFNDNLRKILPGHALLGSDGLDSIVTAPMNAEDTEHVKNNVTEASQRLKERRSKPVENSWHRVPIGETVNNQQVTLDLKIAPHTLVSGGSGTGKTILLNNFILHALNHPNQIKICAIDTKRVEFSFLKDYPENLYGLATNLEDSFKLLAKLQKTLEFRYLEMEEQGVNFFTDLKQNQKTFLEEPAIIVVIDELANLLGKAYGDDEAVKAWNKKTTKISKMIYDLSRKGRAAGIYLVISTQRPDNTIVSGELKANLDNRIAVSRLDKETSRLILGTDLATQTPLKTGRSLLGVNGKLTPFQIYTVLQKDLKK